MVSNFAQKFGKNFERRIGINTFMYAFIKNIVEKSMKPCNF